MKRCGLITLQAIGSFLIVLSAAAIGLAIADIVISYSTYVQSGKQSSTITALALVWVAVGIWASIPVFILGALTLWITKHKMRSRGTFILMVFLSFLIFTPAKLIISIIEAWQGSGPLYSVPPQGGAQQAKFAIPVTIAAIAFVSWLLEMLLAFYVCCCPDFQMRKKVGNVVIQQKVPTTIVSGIGGKSAVHIDNPAVTAVETSHAAVEHPDDGYCGCSHTTVNWSGGNSCPSCQFSKPQSSYLWYNSGAHNNCGCNYAAPRPIGYGNFPYARHQS